MLITFWSVPVKTKGRILVINQFRSWRIWINKNMQIHITDEDKMLIQNKIE